MVRTKAIPIVVAALLAVGCIAVWLLISERQAAQRRMLEFLGTNNEFPTSGGQKMKPEW